VPILALLRAEYVSAVISIPRRGTWDETSISFRWVEATWSIDCNKRHRVERRPYEKCERCGRELRDCVERPQREETGFRTRKEAEAALTTELGNIQTQTYIPPSKITVREYLSDEWLPAVKGTLKRTTYLTYEILPWRGQRVDQA
jgi:hypothetical protein